MQGLPAGLRGNELAQALVSRGFDPNMVGAALTIGDRGAMLTAMLEAAGLSHAQAVATASAARGEVAAQHGLPRAASTAAALPEHARRGSWTNRNEGKVRARLRR